MGEPSEPSPEPERPALSSAWYERRLWQIQPIRDLFWIAVVVSVAVGAIWLGYALRSIFTPVLIALALAYVFQPVIRYAEEKTALSRPAAIGLLMGVMALSALLLAAWLGPQFARQLHDLATSLPDHMETLAERFDVDLGTWYDDARLWAEQVREDPWGVVVSTLGALFAGTTQVFDVIGRVIGTGVYVAVSLLLIGVYFFFFAWHFDAIVRSFRPFIPASQRERAVDLLTKMDQTVSMFFRSRLLIAVIMGAMFSIGWALVGVPYWFLLGMASGLLSLVPFASIIGWPAAVALMWLQTLGANDETAGFNFWVIVFWPSFVYLLVQGIESWFLTPVIQGRSLNMSVVTILIVVFVGGALGGMYGLILCIPLAACGKILLHELVLPPMRQWAAVN